MLFDKSQASWIFTVPQNPPTKGLLVPKRYAVLKIVNWLFRTRKPLPDNIQNIYLRNTRHTVRYLYTFCFLRFDVFPCHFLNNVGMKWNPKRSWDSGLALRSWDSWGGSVGGCQTCCQPVAYNQVNWDSCTKWTQKLKRNYKVLSSQVCFTGDSLVSYYMKPKPQCGLKIHSLQGQMHL